MIKRKFISFVAAALPPKRQRKTKITQDGPPGEGHEALDETEV